MRNYPKNRIKHSSHNYQKTLFLYNEGMSITNISKVLKINRNTINGWIHRGKMPYSIWTEAQKSQMILKMSLSKRGDKNPMWKGDDASLRSAYERAERMYGAICPEGYEIHHIDSNPWNNERENIEFLKRRDHMIKDGRLEKFKERSKNRT